MAEAMPCSKSMQKWRGFHDQLHQSLPLHFSSLRKSPKVIEQLTKDVEEQLLIPHLEQRDKILCRPWFPW
jgi:hypothetical protein